MVCLTELQGSELKCEKQLQVAGASFSGLSCQWSRSGRLRVCAACSVDQCFVIAPSQKGLNIVKTVQMPGTTLGIALDPESEQWLAVVLCSPGRLVGISCREETSKALWEKRLYVSGKELESASKHCAVRAFRGKLVAIVQEEGVPQVWCSSGSYQQACDE